MTMNPNKTRIAMTTKHTNALRLSLSLTLGMLVTGCGPTFDPASLIETTRVLGARVEVEGAPERASPRPGETVNVSWLVTSRDATPPLRWAFAVCAPGNVSLTCDSAPLARFDGTDTPPRFSLLVPLADELGTSKRLVVTGEICSGVDSVPTCTNGDGTTVSLTISLQLDDEANHNPTADRAFTFDDQVWPARAPGGDPCAAGQHVAAGSKDHVIGNTTAGSDRESYTTALGDPPVTTPARESLQISQFTTAGKLKSQFSFVEATDDSAATTVRVKWDAPAFTEVPATGLAVTFTFVTRDNRGGMSWTTRGVCVDR
jgi:hypothetical protein